MSRPSKKPGANPWTKKGREPTTVLFGSSGSDLTMWRDGVALALIPAIVGLYPLLVGHLDVPPRG